MRCVITRELGRGPLLHLHARVRRMARSLLARTGLLATITGVRVSPPLTRLPRMTGISPMAVMSGAIRPPLFGFVRSGLFSTSSSISTLPKAKGARAGGKKDGPRGSSVELRDSASTFADLRITKKLASVAPQLAALPEATREAIAQREVTPYARSLVRGLPRISSSLLINVRGPAVEYLDHPTHRLAVLGLPSAQQRR